MNSPGEFPSINKVGACWYGESASAVCCCTYGSVPGDAIFPLHPGAVESVLLTKSQGTLQERLGLLIPALRSVELRQVVEAFGHAGMFGAKLVLSDGEAAQEERLGLAVPALVPIEYRQIVEAFSHTEMFGTKLVLSDGEAAQEERLGLAVPALLAVEPRQIIEDLSHIEMFWS